MRAKKIFLLIPLLLLAVSAAFAIPQNDIVSDILQKDAALGERQRSVRDSLGAMVRREMMSHAGDSRSGGDTIGGMRLQVSLLTCGPGPEIYEYYGHSAIRVVRTDTADFDLVFNYGVFDFNSGNFALRFALGHTDYICAMQQTIDFVEAYRRKGIYIDEQVLNVTQLEASRILNALLINCQPENCVYRYSFFYDNCATRVRDMIERCLDGKLRYPVRPTERSLRSAVHYYSHDYRWATFGQDLLLGSEADQPATGRELQFAPLIMQQDFASTLVVDSTGIARIFAGETHRLLDLPPVEAKPSAFSPQLVAVVLLLTVLLLGVWEWRKGRILWPVDTVLLVVQGLAGIIVSFLYFFSTHPTVDSNCLVWVLNPLPLVGLYWQIKGGRTCRYWYYHAVALVVLAVFLLSLPTVSQYVGFVAVLMLVALLLRSLTNVLVWLKNKRKTSSAPRQPKSHKDLASLTYPLIILPLLALDANAASRLPRVVVSIAIDGLRSDLLDAFMPLYGEGGFRLLMSQGCVFTNGEYPSQVPNRASSIATLATGTVPYDHGIIDLHWLSRNTLRPTYCVDDPSQHGLNTAVPLSPRNLGVSTVGDELKVATRGQALVYAFAPVGDAAVLSAGHAADGAFWLDPKSCQWAGTTYYAPQLPAWVTTVNGQSLSINGQSSIVNGQWPMVNELVGRMAASCFKYTTIGNDEVPDYMALALSAMQQGREAEAIYTELDNVVSGIISATEANVGQGNALFVLTSTGTDEAGAADLEAYRIPTGSFYIDRTANLLNMMLMALYGQGNYVEAIYDNHIFLNHKLIEQKQLNMGEVLDHCQELLLQSEGVKNAYSAKQLQLGGWTPGIEKIRNSYNPHLSGDIMVQVAPGWHLVNETTGLNKLVRDCAPAFPILFYGLDLPAKIVETPVSTDRIAPTLTGAMRIRAPNACRTAPLPIYR